MLQARECATTDGRSQWEEEEEGGGQRKRRRISRAWSTNYAPKTTCSLGTWQSAVGLSFLIKFLSNKRA